MMQNLLLQSILYRIIDELERLRPESDGPPNDTKDRVDVIREKVESLRIISL